VVFDVPTSRVNQRNGLYDITKKFPLDSVHDLTVCACVTSSDLEGRTEEQKKDVSRPDTKDNDHEDTVR
jgi:hypothetical protein